MAGNPKQKLKLLYMADFLKKNSDEDHCVSVADIETFLLSKEITSERKSIYRDLEVLKKYGMPIETGCIPKRGYYVESGEFQFSEMMMLIDAIQASPIISSKKSRSLIDKIAQLGTVHQSRFIEKRVNLQSRTKSVNEELYYNIDRINLAINRGVKVRFLYQKCSLVGNLPVYDAGREFVISPYATIWHEDKYYIVGNYEKYDDLSHYRIDKMRHVECTGQEVRPFREVSSYTNFFDTADYSKKVFNMFAGHNQRVVELVCQNRLLEHIIERFGINLPYRRVDDESFCVKVQAVMNEGFESWLLNYGGKIVVKSPEELRIRMKERLSGMLEAYNQQP